MVRLPDGEKFVKICLFVSTEYRNVTTDEGTDRQTGGRRTPHDGIGRASIASRGNNEPLSDGYRRRV